MTELASMTTLNDARAARALLYSEAPGPLQEGSCSTKGNLSGIRNLHIFDNKVAFTKLFQFGKKLQL